jgi:hypothetical protein
MFIRTLVELGKKCVSLFLIETLNYEKYFNFHDSGNFMDSIDQITKDALEQLNIDKSKSDEVQDYIQSLYDLSDGISVIMAPNKELNLNDIDQVQRFQY